MDQTPASHETKLGILGSKELNLHEAVGFKKVWDFLLKSTYKRLTPTLINEAHKAGFGFLYD